MSAENLTADIVRDTELEQRLLEAVIADRNDQPRSKQLQVGPSQVGGCRELLRAGFFEPDTLAEPETQWATAAHWGSVDGADLERIFGERLNAVTQQRITTMFGMLGVQISGATDLIFVEEDQISDLKSTDDIGGILYDMKRNASIIETLLQIRSEGLLYRKNIETPDGGYELTEVLVSKIAKLHYYVQVAIYVLGAMQSGVLTENGTARLIFYDRSGNYQGFVAIVIPSDYIDLFYEIGQMRIQQVVKAQEAYEATGGNPAVIAHLRDMAPSFCFSPKVMCPRRMHCWAGSEWTSNNQITNPDQIAATNRYVVGRDLEKVGKAMKASAKEELKEVTGMLPDGKMVTWTHSGAINIVETTVSAPQTQARLDEYVPAGDPVDEAVAEAERKAAGVDDSAVTARAMRERDLGKLQKPELVTLCMAAGLEPKGVKATLIGRILDHEAEHGEIQVESDAGILVAPSEVAETSATAVADDELVNQIVEAAQQPIQAEPVEVANIPGAPGEYFDGSAPEGATVSTEWQGELTTYAQLVDAEMAEADAAQRELIETAMQGGPEGDEAADQLQGERDPRVDRVHFVDTDPRPIEEENVLLPGDQGMPYTKALIEQPTVETQKTGYDSAEALQLRQRLFGLTPDELQQEAMARRINPFEMRQTVIQHIIDHDYPPVVGRGWMPNGEGTSGDATTDRLRQMQYNADPAMRRNYEEENR